MGRVFKVGVVIGIVLSSGFIGALPAHADFGIEAGVMVPVQTDAGLLGLHTVVGSASATLVPAGLGLVDVEFDCKAMAFADAASTGIDVCTVDGVSALNSPNNIPGPASVAVGDLVTSVSAHTACIQVHAAFLEGLAGPSYLQSPLMCGVLVTVQV